MCYNSGLVEIGSAIDTRYNIMTNTTKRTRRTKAQIAADNAALELELEQSTDALLQEPCQLESDDDAEDETGSKMAKALNKARGAYTKSVASSGKKSLHNGDPIATLLAGCEPIEVCQLADLVCEEPIGTHDAKYSHLNQGQQRMNAGNKIRGRIKRNEILAETVIGLANGNLPTLTA